MLTLDPWVDNKSFLSPVTKSWSRCQWPGTPNPPGDAGPKVGFGCRVGDDIFGLFVTWPTHKPQIHLCQDINKLRKFQVIDTKDSKVGKSFFRRCWGFKSSDIKENPPTDYPTNCYVPLSTLPFLDHKNDALKKYVKPIGKKSVPLKLEDLQYVDFFPELVDVHNRRKLSKSVCKNASKTWSDVLLQSCFC